MGLQLYIILNLVLYSSLFFSNTQMMLPIFGCIFSTFLMLSSSLTQYQTQQPARLVGNIDELTLRAKIFARE